MTRILAVFATALVVLCAGTAATGAAGTVAFSSDDTGSFPKTVRAERGKIVVDLSPLGTDAAIHRAVLWPKGEIRGNHGRDKPLPVIVKAGDAVLPLLPPRHKGFVCTEQVARAVRSGAGKIAFSVVSLPGYKGEGARLEVTGSVAPKAKIPAASNLQARHRAGQTFLTWAEPDPPVAEAKVNSEQFAKVLAELAKRPAPITFRIYRHTQPITGKTIARAELIDEVGPLTCWNADIRGKYTLDAKGEKAIDLPRYVVRDGGDCVPAGTGLYVHNPKQAGEAYYAVSVAVGGQEDLSRLASGSATAGPVRETVGQGEPVLQGTTRLTPKGREHHFYYNNADVHHYVRWEAPPNANLPSKPLNYLVGVPRVKVASRPVQIRLHGWGGSMYGGGFWPDADKGTLLMSTNQIPYDWWTGYHEHSWTWQSWADGVVRDYSQRRLLSFVDWMGTKWPVDMTRVSVGGGSMGGSGTTNLAVHRARRIAWANGTVGVHVPDSSPQFTSSYIHSYGQVKWQLPFENRTPAFRWFSNEWYVLSNVKEDLPLIVFSNGKNDGQIGWPQAVRFFRALQKARQPHVFKWGMGGHGEGTRLPGPGSDSRHFALDVRTDRTLPAFTDGSLDEDVGTGTWAMTREEYERRKKEVGEWNKTHPPKERKLIDKYDGAIRGMANGWLYWLTDDEHIVDEPGRWSLVLALHPDAPGDECTVDVTPRRCRKFAARPGQQFTWTNLQGDGADKTWSEAKSGTATADKDGLVTIEDVKVTKRKNRITVVPRR